MYIHNFSENNTTKESLIIRLQNFKFEVSQGKVVTDKKDPDQMECTANDPHLKPICDEYYRGPYFGYWHDGGWVTDRKNCSQTTKNNEMKDLLTVLIIYQEEYFDEDVIKFANRFNDKLNMAHRGMRGIIGTKTELPTSTSSIQIKNVQVIKFSTFSSESEMWLFLIRRVNTPYVLVGRSLHTFYGKWANLERSTRLLGSK